MFSTHSGSVLDPATERPRKRKIEGPLPKCISIRENPFQATQMSIRENPFQATQMYPKTRKTIPGHDVSQNAKTHSKLPKCIPKRQKPSRDTMYPKTPKTIPGHNVSQYGKNHPETPYVLTREKPSRDATCPDTAASVPRRHVYQDG